MATGSACPADKSRVMSSSPSNLIAAGVKKETSVNQAPDWGLIIGRLCHVTLPPLLFIGCFSFNYFILVSSEKRGYENEPWCAKP